MTNKIAVLFPGQGSQYVGMMQVLHDNFPWTKTIFEEASDAIKIDIFKLCQDGTESDLKLTFNAQPAILTTSYAWFQVFKKTIEISPYAVAGHSLGEYSALLSSGAFSLQEAVQLVRKRGELMQSAIAPGKGKMAALIGLSDEKVKELCLAASNGETSIVVPANFNAPSQVVVAGHSEAVDRLSVIATDGKIPELKARKVISLNVSAPFHSPLMKQVALDFVPFLEKIKWQNLCYPIVSNLDAKMRSSGDMVSLLRDQIDHSVLWTNCTQTLESSGTEVYLEMGPQKVLSGLVKRIVQTGKIFNVDSIEDLNKFEKTYQENFQ